MKNGNLWRKVVCSLVIASLTVSMAGCAGKQEKAAESEEVAADDIKGVKLRFAQEKLEDAELKAIYEEIFAEYKELSGVDVELEVVTGDFPVWLTTQHIANNAPDVVVTNYTIAREDYKKGYVLDLGEYINEPNPYNDGKPLSETVRKSLLDACADPDSGATPILPYAANGVRLVYNKSLFEEAGIKDVPVTYDEFIEVCKKLKDSGITPLGLANASDSTASLGWWLNTYTSQMDEEFRKQIDLNADEIISKNELVAATDKGLIDFTKEPFSKSYQMFKELMQYCNSDFNSTSEAQAIDLWLGEKVAMTLMISVRMKSIKDVDMGFEYDVMKFPLLTEENYPDVSGKNPYLGGKLTNGYIITQNEDPKKQRAAIDFTNYMLSPDVVKKLMDASMILPPIDGVGEGSEKWVPSESEELIKAEYYSTVNFKEFVDFNTLSSQLYLSDEISEQEFFTGLNEEWKANCEKAKQENGWSEENEYGNKKS